MNHNVLTFLRELKENNNRPWFQQHKTDYEAARGEVERLVNAILPVLARWDPALRFTQTKDCMFRIYRDVRFSKDKSPYKLNMGAWMTPTGRKSSGPGYYIHLQPGESFLTAGVYTPDPDTLKKIRQEVYYNPKEFRKILEDKKLRKFCEGLEELEIAKLPPRDFPRDFEEMDLLRHKHYLVTYPLEDAEINSDGFEKLVLDFFGVTLPFIQFLRRALEP